MTVHKLSAGDGYTYLTRQVASADQHRERGQDLAGYYATTGNPPGRWVGTGTQALGVSGPVAEDQMRALFGRGAHPDSARIEALERAAGATEGDIRRATRLGTPFRDTPDAKGRLPVAGYDLVFTPVKSVSLLWALGDERVRQEVEAAHHEAVADTLAWLETHAAFTRTGKAGIAQVDTHGLVAAAFDHRDSRLGDPDLHTHVAVSNKVLTHEPGPGAKPRWLALDGRALYRAGVAASERYNTHVEDALVRRLGVGFTPRPTTPDHDQTAGGMPGGRGRRPVREITGIPPGLIRGFSRRRTQIEDRYTELAAAYRTAHGRDPDRTTRVRLAQQATLETREAKKPATPLGEQLAAWRARATHLLTAQDTAAGRGVRAADGGSVVDGSVVDTLIAGVLDRPDQHHEPSEREVAAVAARVLATLEAERATWTRWNLLAEIERATRSWHPPTPADRDRLVTAALERATGAGTAVRIEAPQLIDEPAVLCRADGQSVFTEHAAERYTTTTVLDAEQALLDATTRPAPPAATADLVDQVVAVLDRSSGRPLGVDQRTLVDAFTTTPTHLVVAVGAAGSGKTTAMRAACAVWDATGHRVIPLASSAKAADVLGTELGRRAENLHKYLHDLTTPTTGTSTDSSDRDGFFVLGAGDVLLVDEAGMAGTHQLAALTRAATAAGAVVRLLGDPYQLTAVETGGALRLLAHDTAAVELTGLHRFTNPNEAAATLRLRHGDPAALDFYQQNHRIRAGSVEAMVDAAYAGWAADSRAGLSTTMATTTATLAAELSARARLDRITAGLVHPHGTPLADGNTAGVGDWICTRRNNRLLPTSRATGRDSRGGGGFVKNGDRWLVTGRRSDGALAVTHLRSHATALLPADYVAVDVELAYATTAHRLQGDTVDTCHPIITDQTSREALYVLASRARHQTTLYVATEPAVDVAVEHAPPAAQTPRQVLEQVLANTSAELSATQTIRDTQTTPTRIGVLVAQYGHAADTAATRPDAADWPAHLRDRADLIRTQARRNHHQQPPQPRPPAPPPQPPAAGSPAGRGRDRSY